MTAHVQLPAQKPILYTGQTGQARFGQNPAVRMGKMGEGEVSGKTAVIPADLLAQSLKSQRMAAPKIHFGFNLPYDGVYDHVVAITDFNDQSSNARAEAAFWQSLKFAQINRLRQKEIPGFPFNPDITDPLAEEFKASGVLKLHSVTDVPGGNTSFAALQLNEFGDTLAGRKVVFHVTDPGVGNGRNGDHDRTILVTKDHVFVGPNNGSLALYVENLQRQGQKPGEDFRLYQIDINKVQEYERRRLGRPDYEIPGIYHGRDLFAPVAGAIAGGVQPEAFADLTKSRGLTVRTTAFADTQDISLIAPGFSAEFYGVQDNTCENVKTNLTLSADDHRRLIGEGAVFEVVNANDPDKKLAEVPLKKQFSEVRAGKPVAYLGSHYAEFPKRRFVEFALNLSTINGTEADDTYDGHGAASRLGVDKAQPQRLLLRRVR